MRYDVVVVGAGIAGLHTAYRLHQEGHHVLLLEASGRAGGKIQDLTSHGIIHHMSALVTMPNSIHVHQLVEEVLHESVEPTRGDCRATLLMDGMSARAWLQKRQRMSTAQFYAGFTRGFRRYIAEHRRLMGPSSLTFNWNHMRQHQEELSQSLAEFLKRNDITVLDGFFRIALSGYGYGGDFRQLPLVYAMLYVHAEAVESLLYRFWRPGSNTIPSGFSALVNGLWQQLQEGRVGRLHSRVVSVQAARQAWRVIVYGRRQAILTRHVVWACPGHVVARLCPNLSVKRTLKSQTDRFVSAILVLGAKNHVSDSVQDISLSAQGVFGTYRNDMCKARGDKVSLTVFQGAARRIPAAKLRRTVAQKMPAGHIVAEMSWDHMFPHWVKRQAASYFALQEAQGQNNQWYVGGYATFECVEAILKHSCWVVKQLRARL